MKKYLAIALALMCMNLHASENPFDLEENLDSLENEDELLFATMKKNKTKAMPPKKVALPKEPIKIPIEKERKPKVIAKSKVKVSQKEKAIVDMLDKEQAEVHAYESQRAKKQQEKIPKPIAKKVIVKKIIEKKPKLKKPVVPKKIVKKSQVKANKYEDIAVDINLTEERNEAKRQADLAYAAAVREMDKED